MTEKIPKLFITVLIFRQIYNFPYSISVFLHCEDILTELTYTSRASTRYDTVTLYRFII